jgi:hypothetical protein
LPDIEEAKTVAAQIALLTTIELEKVAPDFKNTYTPVQRAIVAALYVSISKGGVSDMGKDTLTRIFLATKDFAHHSGEMSFYYTTAKAFGIL